MRTFLLDTRVFLWSQFSPDRIPQGWRELLSSPEIKWVFSQVSLWEIEIKFDLGKLPLPKRPEEIIPSAVREAGFATQRLQDEAIFLLGKLPRLHRDPFDRLLIATALCNGWEFVTVDPQIEPYPVRTVHP